MNRLQKLAKLADIRWAMFVNRRHARWLAKQKPNELGFMLAEMIRDNDSRYARLRTQLDLLNRPESGR